MKIIKKQQEAKDILKKHYIKPSSTLLIIITKVSASGMTRRMKVVVNNQNVTYLLGNLLNLNVNNYGIKINGCGMDMALWLVDNITYKLYGNKKYKSFKGNGGAILNWKTV